MKPRTAANPLLRIASLLLLVAGAALTIAALFADQLNLTFGGVGLGWKQLIAAIIGLMLLLLGLGGLMHPPRRFH
ncbi:MAG: hypothetical protein IT337_11185 [Thermomicrobiales bacterium]|nr:hypothetical protein [Thermomicrobiales bacterium]